jgi:hypothetical protein
MKRIILFLNLCIVFSGNLAGNSALTSDSASARLVEQLSVFPQEKIYIQTDKPYYITGEKIFYRAFLLDAFSHRPSTLSRYVYVELINPMDSVVLRQMLRPENGLFHNALTLPQNIPQGYYRIRAYTRFMENAGEEYFFTKPVFIADVNTFNIHVTVETEEFNNNQTGFVFNIIDRKTNEQQSADKLIVYQTGKKTVRITPNEDGKFYAHFDISDKTADRNIKLEFVKNTRTILQRFMRLPYTENRVDVTFYPEGGHLVEGEECKIAFKALMPDGNTDEITGKVVDSNNNEIAKIQTQHEGIGVFSLIPENGKKYFAEIKQGDSIFRMEIPAKINANPALHTKWQQDSLFLTIAKPQNYADDSLFLLMHTRGATILSGWIESEIEHLKISRQLFRNGVSHFLLFDKNLNPLSERLVFNYNKNLQPDLEIETDKPFYQKRDSIHLTFNLKNTLPDTIPATFSFSVTDDNDISVDTTTNILSEILLTSELKGYISNSAYYLSDNKAVETNADLLMLTHGWRRYDIPAAIRGEFQQPEIEPEFYQTILGKVITAGFLNSKYEREAKVSAFAAFNNGAFRDETKTNKFGYFKFDRFELPDSTRISIQADSKPLDTQVVAWLIEAQSIGRMEKGPDLSTDRVELLINEIKYPFITNLSAIPYKSINRNYEHEELISKDIEDYIGQIQWRYSFLNGLRLIDLPEVTIKSKAQSRSNRRIFTTDELSRAGVEHTGDLWKVGYYKENEIIIDGKKFVGSTNGGHEIRLLGIKKIVLEEERRGFSVYTKVHILTNNGHFLIADPKPRKKLSAITYYLLGYAAPAEFYAPKYDTPESRNNNQPDLRSTIYWKPDVRFSPEGKASSDFYAADFPARYTVVAEGITNSGELFYKRENETISVRN